MEEQTEAAEQINEFMLDLTQPLGIGFNEHLLAKDVKDGAQASKLGICPGWRVVALGGKQLKETKELVAMVKNLKNEGRANVWASFAAPPSTRIEFGSVCGAVAVESEGEDAVSSPTKKKNRTN